MVPRAGFRPGPRAFWGSSSRDFEEVPSIPPCDPPLTRETGKTPLTSPVHRGRTLAPSPWMGRAGDNSWSYRMLPEEAVQELERCYAGPALTRIRSRHSIPCGNKLGLDRREPANPAPFRKYASTSNAHLQRLPPASRTNLRSGRTAAEQIHPPRGDKRVTLAERRLHSEGGQQRPPPLQVSPLVAGRRHRNLTRSTPSTLPSQTVSTSST